MSPATTFLYGLLLLVLFGWYFFTDSERAKRNLGTVLTLLIASLCLTFAYPPFDQKDADGKRFGPPGKIRLGIDLQGGTTFLIKLSPPPDSEGKTKEITRDMVDQAMEAIRKRVDGMGVSEPVITPQGVDRIMVQEVSWDFAFVSGRSRWPRRSDQSRLLHLAELLELSHQVRSVRGSRRGGSRFAARPAATSLRSWP